MESFIICGGDRFPIRRDIHFPNGGTAARRPRSQRPATLHFLGRRACDPPKHEQFNPWRDGGSPSAVAEPATLQTPNSQLRPLRLKPSALICVICGFSKAAVWNSQLQTPNSQPFAVKTTLPPAAFFLRSSLTESECTSAVPVFRVHCA